MSSAASFFSYANDARSHEPKVKTVLVKTVKAYRGIILLAPLILNTDSGGDKWSVSQPGQVLPVTSAPENEVQKQNRFPKLIFCYHGRIHC